MFAVLLVALLIAEGWGAQGPVGTADGFSPPATAEWEEGPVQDGIPRGDDARRLRVPVTVSLPDATPTVRDLPVRMTLDVKEALDEGGWPMDSSGNPQGFSLDLDSIVVREVDEQGRPRAGERIPVQVFPGSFDDTRSFDPVAEPGVTLRWVLDGDMTGGDERHYFVYFDSDTRGERRPATYTKEDLAPLAAAAGPGRGTQVYIPFYALPQTRGELEERQVRIVNLAEGPNTVRVHEYTRFDRPQTNPAQTFTLDTQGDATTYVFGRDGLDRSQGRLLVDADAPVIAEIFKSRPASQFIPAMDGGFTGSRFLHNPDPENFQGEMYLLCGAPACKGSVVQDGTSQSVDIGSRDSPRTRLDLAAGTPAELVLDQGHAALQTVTNVRSPVAWPSLTAPGPLERSLMMGHADPGGGLMILSETEEARLHLQLFGRNPLTEGHNLPRGHLQHLNIGANPLGAAWDSAPWQNDLSEPGIVRAQEQNGASGLHVVSGTTGSGTSGRLSALVTPETSDGGLTYSVHLPGTSDTTFGNLVIFSPYPDTTVEAQRRTDAGVSRESLGPLSRHETATFDQPGSYTIQADRPVLVAWLRHHADFRMGGWGLGVTELAETSTGAAQFTGPVFDLNPERSVLTGRPGQLVEFQVEVTNLGRTVDGGGISDTARLDVQVPSGWRSAQVVPSTVPLDPEASETVTVQAQVPPEIDPSDGGASLRLVAHSETDSTYEARTTLRVNYEFHRDVEVSIDGMPVESRREILPDENATYLIRVTNQGSLNDTFQLEVSNATSAWEAVFSQIDPPPDPQSEVGIRPTHTPELAPGESVEYALDVRMAVERASRLITQIQATSESDRSVRDTARAVTAFAAERSFRIIVEDPVRLTPPGDTEVYNITVINEADVNEEFQIQIRSIIPAGWTDPRIEWVGVGDIEDPELRLNRTVRLDPHETIHLHVERPIPDNSTPGELALDRLRFQSNFRPDHEAGTEVILRTTTDRSPGFTARFDPERTTTLPGETTSTTLRLESEANAPQQITLKPVAPHGPGWEYRNVEDERPPWHLELKPGETREFPVRIQVPSTAPPHTREETRVVLHATTPGVATPLVTTADLEVAEHEAATVEERSLVANPGRWMENPVLVTNEGNLPTSVTARWNDDDLPEGWQVESAERTVDVGGSRSSTIRIFAPNDAAEEVRDLPLEWVSDTGRVLAAGEWEVHVGIPSFQLRVEQVHASGGSLVVPVWILNDGRVPVHNVNVQLMDGDTVLDRVPLQQILPGKESVAPLVAPRDARDLAVRVTADHEPLGVHVDPSEAIARFEQQEAEQATLPAAAPILVVALVAALLNMRASRNGRWRP